MRFPEPDGIILVRALEAAVLGYLIGVERDLRGKMAGQRTFALVAMGAATFTALGIELFAPGERVVQGVVQGIGFIGAGLIFRPGGGVITGLTTAAAMWAVAGIGTVVGAGSYVLGPCLAVLVIIILEIPRRRTSASLQDDS